MNPLSLSEFKAAAAAGTEILDVRPTEDFKTAFIPGSIHVPLHASAFADWARAVLNPLQHIIVIAPQGEETQALEALLQAGFNKIDGYLQDGFITWQQAGEPADMIIDVEPDELLMDIPFDDKMEIIDVRKPSEYAEGHLKQAMNLPLNEINDPAKITQIEPDDNLYLYCGGGTRSVIAASVLKKHGVHNLHNVAGGFKKIKEEPKAIIEKSPEALN